MASTGNEHPAESLLKRAHPDEIADTIFRERVKQRPLLLRPTSPNPEINARSKRQHERLKKAQARRKSKQPKPLSAKQKRARCIYEVPREQQKYSIYEPLHSLWCSYMREILNVDDDPSTGSGRRYVDPKSSGHLLVTADYHGALVHVVRSRCVSRVGLCGIVVKDTKFTFEIVTRRNEIKTVPKEHSIFKFELPFAKGSDAAPLVFEIYGNQFESRAPDRATRKFRAHWNPDL